MMSLTKPPVGTGTLAKSFQILHLFQIETPSWTQAELSRATGMQRPVISRIARFLNDQGFLTLNPSSGKYRLGPAAIDLGRRAEASFDLSALCQPMLVELASLTEETIILTEYNESRQAAVCIDQIESRRDGLRVFERIGTSFPLHAGAAPKAILALLNRAAQRAYLERPLDAYTAQTVVDQSALLIDLEQTKNRGYAISKEETYPGVVGVAAGFSDRDGHPLGSVAIAGPVHRLTETWVQDAGQLLRTAANRITGHINGDANP